MYDLFRNLWSNLLRNLCYNLSCNLRNNLKLLSFYVQILLDDLAMGFQGNLSMAQTYYTAAKPYLALEHAEVIKKYLHIK